MAKMKYYTQTNNLDNYSDKEFTGYYWMSDDHAPIQVDGKFALPEIGKNPFIIEANLCADDGSVSISIEHIDGQYLVGIVKWEDVGDVVLEKQTYLSHRLKDKPKVEFVRAWIPVADPECEGMEVLQPAWRAFVGFDKIPVEINHLLTSIKI